MRLPTTGALHASRPVIDGWTFKRLPRLSYGFLFCVHEAPLVPYGKEALTCRTLPLAAGGESCKSMQCELIVLACANSRRTKRMMSMVVLFTQESWQSLWSLATVLLNKLWEDIGLYTHWNFWQ